MRVVSLILTQGGICEMVAYQEISEETLPKMLQGIRHSDPLTTK